MPNTLGTILAMCICVTGAVADETPCPTTVQSPDELGTDAMLGASIAIDGDVAVVGAPLETGLGWASGAIYVYAKSGDEWMLDTRLIADDGAIGDMLGVDVDLLGDTIVAGAWFNDAAAGSNSGAAYIFTRQADGTWQQSAKLMAPDASAEDSFGRTVALGDNFCAVGSPLDDDLGPSSGSIHVFAPDTDGIWSHAAKLLHPDGSAGQQLGLGLDADGSRIVGGAPWAHEARGEILFWQRIGDNWSWQWNATMADVGEPQDFFGFHIALDGEHMAVGAYGDDAFGTDAGSIWMLEQVFDGWAIWNVPPPTPEIGAQFGIAVALSQDRLLVGSRFADAGGVDSGAVDVFARVDANWSPVTHVLPPDPVDGAEFGWAMDIEGDVAMVGALYQPSGGAVYAWVGLVEDCGCEGDLDGDGIVGVNDLLMVLAVFGQETDDGDVNNDGFVDVGDILQLIALWGACD